jgi:phosphatidylserine/phosphatidylglycerophosphate/cardiolipin synthase-like enzyme
MNTQNNQSVILANIDVIYLWWILPQKIKDCLGFTIHRIIDGVEEKGLYATVGFDIKKDPRKAPQTTDEWPIQSFNWKDLYAPHDKDIRYRIIPMVGTWDNLKPDDANSITTDITRRTQQFGDVKVAFNRGLLSTQAFAKSVTEGKITPNIALEFITNPKSQWRKRLGGQMLSNIESFLSIAKKQGGKYYAALYEFTDETLINELTSNKDTEIILSNANYSKIKIINGKKTTISINDGTNKDTRTNLHKINSIKVYDRMLGSHIGHNKFVIYADKEGTPKIVLMASMNWTPTGLCGQTNNMMIIESDELAKQYMAYWNQLKDDIPDKQGPDLRNWCASNSPSIKIDNTTNVKLWFSPNTKQKIKRKDAPIPVDMDYVFKLIQGAKKSILFLVFNPGSPSIIDEIKRVSASRPESDPLYVRGAVSDAKMAASVATNIYAGDINKKPDTYKNIITGVAAIPGSFNYFEQELLKLGFATIHDKILVIDPLSDEPITITGSHNLGYTASYKNDESMMIIQNNKPIAQAYAAHVLDVVNHFKWRYKLQDKIRKANAKTDAEKEQVLTKGWHDLYETDQWMDYYFDKNGFINHDKFLFSMESEKKQANVNR